MTTMLTPDTLTAALLEGGVARDAFAVREAPCTCGCGRTTVLLRSPLWGDDDFARVAWKAFSLLDESCCEFECWNRGGCTDRSCRVDAGLESAP